MDYRSARGMLKMEERQCLYDLARQVAQRDGPRFMVNIGVEYGASCICLRQGAPQAMLYAIDIDFTPLDQITRKELGPLTMLIEKDSRVWVPETLHANTGPAFDLVFIDGLHYKPFVRNDAQLAALVVADGFIVFHDAYEWDNMTRPQSEVYPPVQEWFEACSDQWIELRQAGTMRVFQRID